MPVPEPPAETWTLRLIQPTVDAVRRVEEFVEQLLVELDDPMTGYDTEWGDSGMSIT
jgi:hypothetical protein